MADSISESSRVLPKAAYTSTGKWDFLRSGINRLLRRRHSANTQPATNQPEGATTDGESVLDGVSGYVKFIETKRSEDSRLVKVLTDEYPNLISIINSDTRLKPEIKSVLLEELEKGNTRVIAVIAGRLWESTSKDSKQTQALSQNRIANVNYLAKRMRQIFEEDDISLDTSGRPVGVKQSYARDKFYNAVASSQWQPNLPTPAPVRKLPQGVLVSPVIPGKN